jgi:hypothetical protein
MIVENKAQRMPHDVKYTVTSFEFNLFYEGSLDCTLLPFVLYIVLWDDTTPPIPCASVAVPFLQTVVLISHKLIN